MLITSPDNLAALNYKFIAHFFYKNTNIFAELYYSYFFYFEPLIILILFIYILCVTMSANQRIIFKSLLMSYFVIKQNKSAAEQIMYQ